MFESDTKLYAFICAASTFFGLVFGGLAWYYYEEVLKVNWSTNDIYRSFGSPTQIDTSGDWLYVIGMGCVAGILMIVTIVFAVLCVRSAQENRR